MSKLNINDIGKVPPQAIEIEEAFLGAVLLDKDTHDLIDLADSEVFYKTSHQVIFTAIKKLRVEKKNIDVFTVFDELKNTGKADECGGLIYVSGLTRNIGSGLHASEHYMILTEKYLAREAIRLSYELSDLAYSGAELDELEQKITELKKFFEDKTQISDSGQDVSDVANQSLINAGERVQNKKLGKMPGIYTGINQLQEMLGGWQPADLILIAARPSMGKTAMAIFFSKQCAMKGFKTLFFSLEMNAISITDRFVLGDINVNPEHWRNGNMSNFELTQYEDRIQVISEVPLRIYDKSSLRPSEVNSICKREKPDIIFIDYIQLMKVNRGEKLQNRNLEIGFISHELKAIAKEYNIPVIVLCQLNRNLDTRGSKIPALSDLRDSGELEQDADIVIFPYRPYVYSNEPSDLGIMDIIISKHRNGRVGAVKIKHNEFINNFFDTIGESEYMEPVNNFKENPF